MRETRYLSHAWGLLTRDRGWYTPILTLSIYMLVPVVGWLVVLGYEMEWARRVAWGFEGPPQRRGIDIPRCFQSGCRAFVAVLGWCIVWVVLYCAVAMAVTRSYLGPLADALDTLMLIRMLPWFLLSAWSPVGWPLIVVVSFCTVLTVMVGVRATIYQDSAAGYQISRIVEMIKRDAGGYAKISGLVALVALVCEFAPLLLSYVLAFIGVFLGLAGGVLFVLFLYPVIFLLMAVYCTVVFLLIHTMVGLWMRQFDVPSWGKSTDSLPAGQRPSSDARLGSLGGGDQHAAQPYQLGQSQLQGQGPGDQLQGQNASPAPGAASGVRPPDVEWGLSASAGLSRADQAGTPSSRPVDGDDIRSFPNASAPSDRPSPIDFTDPVSLAIEALASQSPQSAGSRTVPQSPQTVESHAASQSSQTAELHAASQSPQSADAQTSLGPETSGEGVRPNEDQ